MNSRKERNRMKTLIAVPCMDMLPLGFVQSLLHMNKGDNTAVFFKPNSLVYDSRNLISLYAIENDFDHVLWLDSDMTFMPDTLLRLEALMSQDLNIDMVTGVYVTRHEPVQPVLYDVIKEPMRDEDGKLVKQIHTFTNYPLNAFFPVAGCGFGCVMTSVRLLKDVWDKFGPAFAPFPWASEDISFCHRVNKLGYQIYCDSSVICGHIGQTIYTPQTERGDDIG